MEKTLRELLTLLKDALVRGNDDLTITNITYDSRRVLPGSLFICLTGAHVDGHDFLKAAYEKGAVAALVERDVTAPEGMTIIRVDNTRQAMGIVVPYFYDYPCRKMRVIGVTGTNGKTTTTHLIRAILKEAGYRVGLIGTIHILVGDTELPIKNTTPDVVDLQATLAKMAEAGMEYVVMEVSSHALAMDRVAGCEFDIGIFTNLTRDHLDFHKTFANYAAAKALLFSSLGNTKATKQGAKAAVINADDATGPEMMRHCHVPVLTYGITHVANITAGAIQIRGKGASFSVKLGETTHPLTLHITGMFNVYNALAAIGAAQACGIPWRAIQKALEQSPGVPGRFELVDVGQPFPVIVDFAHTPDGLENILKTEREFTQGKLITVFGCGGDRDRTKRPIMGQIAARMSDVVIATSDNPRSEDPAAILQEVEAGIRTALQPGQKYTVIVNRREAIDKAIHTATAEDIVIIAGKGHETYQILKDETIHFDDRETARTVLKGMGYHG